jgi:Uma2 family endonuclease
MTLSQLMTADELFASSKYKKHCELINGELRMMSPAGGQHGSITINIAVALTVFIRQHNLGIALAAETGFLLTQNPDTVRAPDFAFIPATRIPAEGISPKFLTIIPALVVEVLSPNDHAIAISEKIEDWLKFGVDQVWVVNPKLKNISIHTADNNPAVLREGDILNGGAILPGFSHPVADIFR